MNDANSKQINISGQHNKFQLKRAQREKQRERKDMAKSLVPATKKSSGF